jgi:hypothetical protein
MSKFKSYKRHEWNDTDELVRGKHVRKKNKPRREEAIKGKDKDFMFYEEPMFDDQD